MKTVRKQHNTLPEQEDKGMGDLQRDIPIKAATFEELMNQFEAQPNLFTIPMQPSGRFLYDVCKELVMLRREIVSLKASDNEISTLEDRLETMRLQANKQQEAQFEPIYTREQLTEMAKSIRGDGIKS